MDREEVRAIDGFKRFEDDVFLVFRLIIFIIFLWAAATKYYLLAGFLLFLNFHAMGDSDTIDDSQDMSP